MVLSTDPREAIIDVITSRDAREEFFNVSKRANQNMGSGMIKEYRKALLGKDMEVAPFRDNVKIVLSGDPLNPRVTLDFYFMVVYDFLSGDEYDLPDHEYGMAPVWLHTFRMLDCVKSEYGNRNLTIPLETANRVIDEVIKYWNEGRLPHFIETAEDGQVLVADVVYRDKALKLMVH